MQQPEAGRLDREGVGVDRGDERAAIHIAADGAGFLDLGDRADARDHGRSGRRQLDGLTGEALAVLDDQQVCPS